LEDAVEPESLEWGALLDMDVEGDDATMQEMAMKTA
jgi:hypothetical protein